MAEGLRGERVAVLEFLDGADGVDAPDEASDPLERAFVAELGRATATARIDRNAEIGKTQGMHGRDDRDLALGELVREGVLFVGLRLAPAARTVDLRDVNRAVLAPGPARAALAA